MKNTKTLFTSLLLALSLVVSSIPIDAFAKGSSFSGSRSSSFSSGSKSSGSSFGGSKSSSGGGWGSSSKSSNTSGSKWGSSSTTTTKPTTTGTDASKATIWGSNSSKAAAGVGAASATDQAIANKSSMTSSDKKAASQRAAIADKFKKDNANNYPTKFSSEPTSRPSYVPTYQSDRYGTARPIYYDQGRGGYGYWDALGTFIIYDALTSRANNYAATQPVYVNNGSSGSGAAITVILILLIVGGGFTVWAIRNRD